MRQVRSCSPAKVWSEKPEGGDVATQNRSRQYRHGSSLLCLRLLYLPALLLRPNQHACPGTAPARPHSGTALECEPVRFRVVRRNVFVRAWVESLDRNPGKWFSVCVCPDELGGSLRPLRLFLAGVVAGAVRKVGGASAASKAAEGRRLFHGSVLSRPALHPRDLVCVSEHLPQLPAFHLASTNTAAKYQFR